MTEQTPADAFCDGLIARCQDNDRPFINEHLVDKVLRPYLAVLDDPATVGQSSEWFADALVGVLATMTATFVGRTVPPDDRNAAMEIAQDIINAMSASLTVDLISSYEHKPSQVELSAKALRKKAGLLN